MKLILAIFIATFLMANNYALSGPLDSLERKLDKIFGQKIESGAEVKAEKKRQRSSKKPCKVKRSVADKLEGKLDKLFGQEVKTRIDAKCKGKKIRQVKKPKNKKTRSSYLNADPHSVSLYTGTFDLIDKEGDDKTSLFGVEHKNKNLFRDTWVGKFSPTTGAFVTGKSSVYFYTGIEADYNLGPISVSPSFAPGYYQKGDGKDLGSVLEFKSEIKVGLDLFESSKIGYSYSHISNNDWGKTNPGTDNQSITYSKKF